MKREYITVLVERGEVLNLRVIAETAARQIKEGRFKNEKHH